MKNIKLSILASLMLAAFSANAVTVVVHPSNTSNINAKAIKKIFLGKTKKFPGGEKAIPVELEGGETRGQFLNAVVGKSESQYKAYWSKLVFTGKGQPPRSINSDAEVIDLISKNANLIGYVSDDAVNDTVKVVGKF